ncbi:MAG: hypothetical protein ACAI35_05755 [Candidatus Methylacidiphilales bacterium]|nr:hypothetical protein [Candidatus Methylacidiphilales bacterium]
MHGNAFPMMAVAVLVAAAACLSCFVGKAQAWDPAAEDKVKKPALTAPIVSEHSELEAVTDGQRKAFPPFYGVWEHTVHTPGDLEEAKSYRQKTIARIAQLRSEAAGDAKKLERAEKLEKGLDAECKKLSEPGVQSFTFRVTYLSPERFKAITVLDVVERSITYYRVKDDLLMVMESPRKIAIQPYSDDALDFLLLGLPAFSMDEWFKKKIKLFELTKAAATDDGKGISYSGMLHFNLDNLSPENREKTFRLGPAKFSAVYDASNDLQRVEYTHGPTVRFSKTYSDYREYDGIRMPQKAVFRTDTDGELYSASQRNLTEITLVEFRKLTEAEIQSTSTAYEMKPGYKVIDSRSGTVVATTTDELLKKKAALESK